MLELRNITKDYVSGDETVHALSGVSVAFRESEFVAVLGPSGCGKTTLLNIVGGLDQYTDGDLLIDGISTKRYEDADWDVYRNHRIGFVFQSYNLIPHQTVLSNVELALTLSGVSKAERRARAIAALERVGLGDQLKKKPSQMSGGQMQRVAIARALVNNPQIVLADEPTGALDTQTSEQIMEILKEISKDKLIIMVTHNPDLAERYATRTIGVLDGNITSDSNPYVPTEQEVAAVTEVAREKARERRSRRRGKKEKTSMSFLTALSLSLNNLMTKKTRTLLTSFAGSIGIIGIALILALSNGIQLFIDRVQEDTLSSYPLSIESTTMDMNAMLETMAGASQKVEGAEEGYVYPNNQLSVVADALRGAIKENDLEAFKTYLESEEVGINDYATLKYHYGVTPMVWRKYLNDKGEAESYLAVNPSKAYEIIGDFMGASGMSMNGWDELLDNQDLLENQYELVYGAWPQSYNEVVLIVDENSRLSDLALYSLGVRSEEELEKVLAGEEVIYDPNERYSYADLVDIKLTLLLASDRYEIKDKNNLSLGCTDLTDDPQKLFAALTNKGIELTISGVIRVNPDATAVSVNGIIGYTPALTQYLLRAAEDSEVGKAQLANPDIDVISGKLFPNKNETEAQKVENLTNFLSTLSVAERATWYMEQLPTLVLFDLVSQEAAGIMANERYPDSPDGIANLQADIRTALESDPELLDMMGQMFGYDMSAITDNMRPFVIKMLADSCTDYPSAVQMMGAILAMPRYEAALTAKMGYVMMLPTAEAKVADMNAYLDTLPDVAKATLWDQVNPGLSSSTYAYNCRILGIADPDIPSRIDIYPKSFDAKEKISELIDAYNGTRPEGGEVVYTDYIGVMLSSISVILDVITYVLVGFVAISLVVSSIMIGIITYISVLERIKEIGILRAIGASKRDVSSVFLAESMIVGFGAGLIGIFMTLLLCLPINLIIQHLSGFQNLGAELPFVGAVALVLISVILTLVAGAIPASIAAKREPVEALRSE